jgi:hypothetical protein
MSNFNFKPPFNSNDKVKFIGCSQDQISWGNNDDPNMLILDEIYVVECVEVHSQHTKISLKGVGGKFNSVCFSNA